MERAEDVKKVEPLTDAEKTAYREALVRLAVDAYGIANSAHALWVCAEKCAGGVLKVNLDREQGQGMLLREIAERGRSAELARAASLALLIQLRDAPEDIPPDEAREKTAMVETWWARRVELACGTAAEKEVNAEAQGRGEGREG